MRNRVMNVEQIQVLSLGHSRHLGRQGKCVWLMLKQRIRHHLNFMKTHPLVQFSQPGGQGRRNEMHRVAARRELLAKLRADDTAATVGWIDCDPDVHSIVSCQFSMKGKGPDRSRRRRLAGTSDKGYNANEFIVRIDA